MENVFNIKYNTKLDRLEIPKENWKRKILKFMQKHKFFSVIITSFFVLSGLNFYLVFSFIKILENI